MPKNCLLVIDAQKIYTSPDSEMFCEDSRGTLKRINSLISLFEDLRSPIVFVRHVHRADGTDLGRMFDFTGEPEDDFNFKVGTQEVEYDESLAIPDSAVHVVKTRYSAFVGTRLNEMLRKADVGTVTICGFMTNFCCESTARQAHDLDYFVDFVVDATGTPGTDKFGEPDIRKIVADFLSAGFARVVKTSTLLKRAAATKR